jgi:Tfp pilus assembly protein PilE
MSSFNTILDSKQHQRGLTLIGLLMLSALTGVGFLLGMKVMPTYIESLAIQRAVKRAATGASAREIQITFERAMAIDDITSIGPKDLVIVKGIDGYVVSYEYEKRIPLIGPASLLLEYKGQAKP